MKKSILVFTLMAVAALFAYASEHGKTDGTCCDKACHEKCIKEHGKCDHSCHKDAAK